MGNILIPKGYTSPQNIKYTEIAIKEVKDYFERAIAMNLNLNRVSAPLFVKHSTGLNDDLSGVERPVKFGIKEQNDEEVEIVHSLAKWKRLALKRYGFLHGEGLYTDMTAIRRDEDTDNFHSIYVDQWDWEKIIDENERNEATLKKVVQDVYRAIKMTENYFSNRQTYIKPILPEDIFFISSEELLQMYPGTTPEEREYNIVKEKGAVFITKIGGKLSDGERHGNRAPDYDDWELNGDIIVYYPILDRAMELSSMGIRVNKDSLLRQLKDVNCEERLELDFHQMLLNNELPFTIGGGIGQSRICMFFLRCAHIGEVQSSIWPDEVLREASLHGINFL
ncbi:MAG: aspartate--ammonia ligase [Lachnospiraceae bacterium]|nr:aspartate--ammonia ligase [Lachnospiraceae bacterium]